MRDDSTPQPSEQIVTLLPILEQHLAQWKSAYYANMPGVTYEDMAAAARRLLEMRAAYERASGRPVRTRISKKAIAELLR